VTVPIVVPFTYTEENASDFPLLFSTTFPLKTLKLFWALVKKEINDTNTVRTKYNLLFGMNDI
jgi:hypothetical protein